MRLVLALIFFGFALNMAQASESEGRRMLIFAIYGAAGTTGSAATTTVIDFTTMVACREARNALQRDQRPPVRQDGRNDHGNRPFAADAAIRLRG